MSHLELAEEEVKSVTHTTSLEIHLMVPSVNIKRRQHVSSHWRMCKKSNDHSRQALKKTRKRKGLCQHIISCQTEVLSLSLSILHLTGPRRPKQGANFSLDRAMETTVFRRAVAIAQENGCQSLKCRNIIRSGGRVGLQCRHKHEG